MRQSPSQFIRGYIERHEGGLSMNPADNGNWFDPVRYKKGLPQKRGLGTLVGSKFGVTAYALARYRKVSNITAADMAALGVDEAVAIGVAFYYKEPKFDRLPWDRVVASAVDKGWGSGPKWGIKLLQRAIGGLVDDGDIGPATVAAYKAWREKVSEDDAARAFAKQRRAYDLALTRDDGPNDPDIKFINGWNNRTDSFLPGTVWWRNNA